MKKLWRRLTFPFRRSRFERDLDEEMRIHLRFKTEENIDAGMTLDEAQRRAAGRFGNRLLVRETSREVWGFRVLEQLAQDLRYGLRMLRRSPGFTAAAVLSLALGIGPNMAVFALLDDALLKGPSARDAGRLVQVQTGRSRQISYPNYRDLAAAGILDGLAGYTLSRESWTAGDATRTIASHLVTGNFFEVLGAGAVVGRTFTADEVSSAGRPQVVVVTHGFWQRRLAGDPGVVGRDLILNGRPFTVVGVLSPTYRSLAELGEAPELYLPLDPGSQGGLENRRQGLLVVFGRLRAGASPRSAAAALTVAAERLEQAYPEANADSTPVRAYSLSGWRRLERYDDEVWTLAGLLVAVVGLVLLIACANVGGLLLARGTARRREMAMRLAVGAGRRRLVRQLLTESLLLASAASLAGLVLNIWAARLLSRLPISMSGAVPLDLAPDARVLVFAASVATAATLLCGLAPAVHGTRFDLVPALKDESRTAGSRRFSLRRLMVSGQVAVSTLLLVVGALFLRSLAAISTAAPGFDVEHTIVARVELPRGKYTGPTEQAFMENAMSRLEAIPGVRSATCAGIVPLGFAASSAILRVDGREDSTGLKASLNVVGRRYFETMSIPVLRGREFQATDRTGAPAVAIVNEAFVRRFFPGSWPERSPVGTRVVRGEGSERDTLEIVGVVGDSKYFSLGEVPEPQVYSLPPAAELGVACPDHGRPGRGPRRRPAAREAPSPRAGTRGGARDPNHARPRLPRLLAEPDRRLLRRRTGRRGSAARAGGGVRRDQLLGEPAIPGDRAADGARCLAGDGASDGAPRRPGARRRRRRVGFGTVGARDTASRHVPRVRCEGDGCGELCRRPRAHGRGRLCSRSGARTASHPRRSDGGAPL